MVTREEFLEARTRLRMIESVEQLGIKLTPLFLEKKLEAEIVVLKWRLTIKEKKLQGMKHKNAEA